MSMTDKNKLKTDSDILKELEIATDYLFEKTQSVENHDEMIEYIKVVEHLSKATGRLKHNIVNVEETDNE